MPQNTGFQGPDKTGAKKRSSPSGFDPLRGAGAKRKKKVRVMSTPR